MLVDFLKSVLCAGRPLLRLFKVDNEALGLILEQVTVLSFFSKLRLDHAQVTHHVLVELAQLCVLPHQHLLSADQECDLLDKSVRRVRCVAAAILFVRLELREIYCTRSRLLGRRSDLLLHQLMLVQLYGLREFTRAQVL